MGMSCENYTFPLGSLVVVKRGHHEGSVFAVVGIDEKSGNNDRILIADGGKISASKPKRKNLRHVEMTGKVSVEVAQRLAGRKCLDDGWLSEIISRLKS
jgi:ribosomal protein L14E/L6E/L27E